MVQVNRRGFLSMLGIGGAALALDPERLLWVPGKKLISIASTAVDVIDFGGPSNFPVFEVALETPGDWRSRLLGGRIMAEITSLYARGVAAGEESSFAGRPT
jgi:hypothetical protein